MAVLNEMRLSSFLLLFMNRYEYMFTHGWKCCDCHEFMMVLLREINDISLGRE